MKVRVEYETTPIRHVAIQCPSCENWFHGYDLTDKSLHDIIDVEYATYNCPVCGSQFSGKENGMEIEEVSYPKVFEGVLEKKVKWQSK